MADRQASFQLDIPAGGYATSLITGVPQPDGAAEKAFPGTVHGQQVHDSELHELELTVRPEGDNVNFEARLDDQALYQWSGPLAALSLYPKWPPIPQGRLALGALAADWVVYEVKVKRLK